MTYENKKCEICGKEFTTKSWNQIYCSEACQEKQVCLDRPNGLNKPRICYECGEQFMPKSSAQKYCIKCSDIANKRTQKEHNDRKPRKIYEPKACSYCGRLFTPRQHNQIYCCKKCQELDYKESGYNKEKNHKNYIQNIDRYKSQHKKYYNNNKEKTKIRGKINREKRKNNKDYVLKHRIREQIRGVLKDNLYIKDFHTFELLGYTSQDLKNRLESLFEQNSKEGKPKLSWKNMGHTWHIDHINPQSSFIFAKSDGSIDKEAIKKCWALDNLQPLYAEDNVHKSAYTTDGIFWKQGVPISYNPKMDQTL